MRAVILLAEGVQDEEVIYPYYRLQEAGYKVEKYGFGPIKEYKGKSCIYGKYGIPFLLDSVNESKNTLDVKLTENLLYQLDYRIIIVPGGWQCPEILRMNEFALNLIRAANNQKITIGAICHGPQVLISAGIMRNRVATCFEGIKDDLINAGAIYRNEECVVDDNLITAPHYRNNPQFMKAILKATNEI